MINEKPLTLLPLPEGGVMPYKKCMKKRLLIASAFAVFALASCAPSPKKAVATPHEVFGSWQVVTTGKEGVDNLCYAVSAPVSSKGTLKGRSAEPYLMATRRNSGKIEISTTSGYPYIKDSEVDLIVSKKTYTLSFKDKVAWAQGDEEDKAIVKALQKAKKAVVRGVNKQKELSLDTYSLIGFTDAIARVKALCP